MQTARKRVESSIKICIEREAKLGKIEKRGGYEVKDEYTNVVETIMVNSRNRARASCEIRRCSSLFSVTYIRSVIWIRR